MPTMVDHDDASEVMTMPLVRQLVRPVGPTQHAPTQRYDALRMTVVVVG